MIDFNERALPGVTSNFLMSEAYARYQFARKYITKDAKVLDIACGVGYGSDYLSQKSKQIIGIDIDEESIAYAKQHFGKKASFLLGNATDTPFKNDFFEMVVAFEMIEHLKEPNKFLKEVYRILKKGGKLCISTPNSAVHSPDGNLMSPYHVKEYTYEELNKLVSKHFSKVEFYAQNKSDNATKAWKSFLTSQTARRGLVSIDFFGLRKLFPREKREALWRFLGSFFGRQKQESLTTKDFPIRSYSGSAEYFIVVCTR